MNYVRKVLFFLPVLSCFIALMMPHTQFWTIFDLILNTPLRIFTSVLQALETRLYGGAPIGITVKLSLYTFEKDHTYSDVQCSLLSSRACARIGKRARRTYAKALPGVFHGFVFFLMLFSTSWIFYREHFVYSREKGKKHSLVPFWSCSSCLRVLAETVLHSGAGAQASEGEHGSSVVDSKASGAASHRVLSFQAIVH